MSYLYPAVLSSLFDAPGKVCLSVPLLLQDCFVPLNWNTSAKKFKVHQRLEAPSQSLQEMVKRKAERNFNDFDDALVLNIFNYLPLVDLAKASQVCQRWYQISFDEVLWKKVDLRRFSKLLNNEDLFEAFAKSRLSTKVYDLDLTGLVLTEKNMNVIAVQCTNLRSLTLKCVTFKSSNSAEDVKDTSALIPKQLQWLDIRFSRGSPSVFSSIASQLQDVKSVGVCDGFLQTLIASPKLIESTITRLTNSLENLDMSQCLFVTDKLLELFARCKKLKVLSLRKCNGVFGNSLRLLQQNCPRLETLILDGTSIEDVALENMEWEKSLLKHLELGWCPLVTSTCLKKILPQIAQIPTLQYLGLCDVGQGKAVTDDVLASLAAEISEGAPHKSLLQVNIGSLHSAVTNEVLDATCCATSCEVVTPKSHDTSNRSGGLKCKGSLFAPKRAMFSSATTFPLPRYNLETPL